MRAFRLGVTGGIGSGKSTVAALCAEQGAAHIDADAIARTVTAAGGAAIPAIQATFGNAVMDAQGALDRTRMRTLVFADPAARQQLEAIIHPLVGQAIGRSVHAAQQRGCRLLVLDIPLLTESVYWLCRLDAVLVVDCLEATQMARVIARSGLARDTVQAIIASQNNRAVRRAAADWVLYNDGISLSQLRCKVHSIVAHLTK